MGDGFHGAFVGHDFDYATGDAYIQAQAERISATTCVRIEEA
jgi:hypothetical protein